MSPNAPSRRLPTVIAVAGVALTCLAAAFVVAVGRDTGSGADDLVLVPRAELEAAAAEQAPLYALEEIARLEAPTQVAPRAGSDDIYVTLLAGQVVRLTPDGEGGYDTVEPPVLDISADVSAQPGLEGLGSLAFSPDGATLYLGYTDKAADQVVSAFGAADDGASFGPGNQIIAIDWPDTVSNNHIGGSLAFGPDGYLYIGTGDAGVGAFQAPDSSSLYGKVLRIEPNPAGGYTSPEGNTVDGPDALPEIWTVGLRNPFRIDFDRESGDLWVADVGEESVEEINRLGVEEAFGKDINLGWPQYAGSAEYFIDEPAPTRLPPTPPSFEYSHREGRCAVIGGEVYRGAEFPALAGQYLFSDVCSKALVGLRDAPDGGYEEFVLASVEEAQMVSVDAANDGTIFLTSNSGGIYRLAAA